MKQTYQLEIDARIRQTEPRYMSDALEIRETLVLSATSFLELAQILARFHDLADAIAREQGRP